MTETAASSSPVSSAKNAEGQQKAPAAEAGAFTFDDD
jgi:hypothetical protein